VNPLLSVSKFAPQRPWVHAAIVFLGFLGFYTLFFSPILFSDRLLAPGDGISYFLPAFYGAKTLWTNLVFGGYPLAADPQNMTWYPLVLLLSWIPHSWNAFIVLAYVLAGSFAYCYLYTITRSRLAATVAGLVYSLSGFMMGHLGHAGMIHAAAWIPLLVCALENLRQRITRTWIALGGVAFVGCALGGHPQISVYGLGVGVFYALFLGWTAPIGRAKFYRNALLLLLLGVGLCAIQLLPTVELSQLSLRSVMTWEAFFHYSLPRWQTVQLLFPYFFGSAFDQPYKLYEVALWGPWGLGEISGYVGLMPVMLGAIGAIAYPQRSIVRFWFWFGLITLACAFGGDLLVGQLLYHVPVYNKFRAQGRHFIEVAMAMSVLSGCGVAAIQQRLVSNRLLRRTIGVGMLVMIISLIGIQILGPHFQLQVRKLGLAPVKLSPWNNPAIGIPVLIFCASSLSLAIWSRWRRFRWSALLLVTMLTIDLSSFGWFIQQIGPPAASQLQPSDLIQRYQTILRQQHQRIFTAGGAAEDANRLYPNLNRLWDLPNAGGYSPLTLTRVSEVMQMSASGALSHIPQPYERGLDIMSARYLITPVPAVNPPLTIDPQVLPAPPGSPWAAPDLGMRLGMGACTLPPHQATLNLTVPELNQTTSEIRLITSLGCSVSIPDRAAVLEVQVTDAQGKVETHPLLAGRDTAEQAYNCPNIHPLHQRAPIFQRTPGSSLDSDTCITHQYVSTIKLNQPQAIKQLHLKWGNFSGVILIHKMSLRNGDAGQSTPILPTEPSSRWRRIERLPNGAAIYENQQAMPRTWLVPATRLLSPALILSAVTTTHLPGGQVYQPGTLALVEDPAAQFQSAPLQPSDTAPIVNEQETMIAIQTHTAAPAFLVLSDVHYPGWQATIDGQPTPIFQTNYIQRGVKVPAGDHRVQFSFRPVSFRLGAGITIASAVAGLYWLTRIKPGKSI
jgi:Bacterial membrane protein YfhO